MDNPETEGATKAPRLLTDRELAPLLRVSTSFLQHDRREAQRIPFVRLGDKCLYDFDEVMKAVRFMQVGGTVYQRRRRVGAPDAPTTGGGQ